MNAVFAVLIHPLATPLFHSHLALGNWWMQVLPEDMCVGDAFMDAHEVLPLPQK